MITVISDNPKGKIYGAGIVVLGMTPLPTPIINYPVLDALIIPNYQGDSVTIDIEEVAAIASIVVDGIAYTLQDGVFTFNGENLTINLPNFSGKSLIINGIPIAVNKANFVKPITDIPSWLKQFPINKVSWTRNWKGHPSGNFELSVPIAQKTIVEEYFKIGTPLTLFGIGFRVGGLQVTEFPKTNKVTFAISLQGYWEELGVRCIVDRPFSLSGLGSSYSVNTLAKLADVPIVGKSLGKKIPKTEDNSETVTLREALDNLPILSGLFVDYDSPNQITLVDWLNTPIHLLTNADITQDTIDRSYNGFGASYKGVELYREVINGELVPEVEATNGTSGGGEGKIKLTEGDIDAATPPLIDKGAYYESLPSDYLRSPNQAFDSGGQTKTIKEVTTFNGTAIEEVERTYGFLYTSIDVHTITENSITFDNFTSPASYWKQVKQVKTVYQFDAFGYSTGSTTTGWEMARFKTESDELEAAKLQQELLTDPTVAPKIALYKHSKVPIDSHNKITLASLIPYYKDLTQPTDDPVVGEPKYAASITTSEDNLRMTPDPDSTEDEPLPPIVAGKRSLQIEQTSIVIPQSKSSPQTPEIYRTRTKITNAEGQNFKNAISTETFADHSGRPSVQSRLDTTITPTTDDGDDNSLKIVVHTPDAPTYGVITESFSFTGATNTAIVRCAAITQIGWENTENALTTDISTFFLPQIRMGDRVWYQGKIWTVLGCDGEIQLRQQAWYCTRFSLSLGYFMDVPLISNLPLNIKILG